MLSRSKLLGIGAGLITGWMTFLSPKQLYHCVRAVKYKLATFVISYIEFENPLYNMLVFVGFVFAGPII